MYNGTFGRDIQVKIGQIQSEVFKKGRSEPNISESDQYESGAKKVFQHGGNQKSDEFGKICMVRNAKS